MKRILCSLLAMAACLAWSAEDTVVASRFGFDEQDATPCLQKALDSGAKTVVVDNTGKPWIVRPVALRSNQEVVLQDGVVIRAKSGEYKSRVACMLNICSVQNVTLRGEGTARLEMPKADYMDESKYEWAEWRHAINIAAAKNVTIRNLTAKGSGGDGVYIRSHSKDIVLEDLVMLDHHRQGISIISVENLTVRRCTFNETWGTAPMCGLDIEPNVPQDVCRNILFEDCVFDNNRSAGICLHLLPLDHTSQPISVTFRNCLSRGNSGSAFTINAHNGKPYKGTVLVEDCTFSNNKGGVLRLGSMHCDGVKLAFKNCTFDNTGSASPAINFAIGSSDGDMAGVSFEKCTLNPGKTPVVNFIGKTGFGITDVTGDIMLPDGKPIDLAGLKAKYRPNPELRKFDVAKLDTKALKPMGGNQAVDADNRVWMRYGCKALQYFPKAGEYPIRFLVSKYNDRNATTRVTILDPNGNEYGKFAFNETDYTYVFKARGEGIFRFVVSTNFAVAVESSTPGFGIDASDRVPMFRGGKHRLYFVVPAGVEDVKVEAGGEQGEPITAELLNAKGESVCKAVKMEGASFLVGKRPANAPAEVWSVNMTNVFEDHGFRIGAPCIPVFYTNPNMLFIGK